MFGVVEHRFTGEQATHTHAIQAAHQTSFVIPGFHRMRHAAFEQLRVHGDHILVDPAVGTLWVGAAGQHLLEGGVDRGSVMVERLPQRMTHPQRPQRKDGATYGRPPAHAMKIGLMQRHREQARRIGCQRQLGVDGVGEAHELLAGPIGLQTEHMGKHVSSVAPCPDVRRGPVVRIQAHGLRARRVSRAARPPNRRPRCMW